jgi:hypothetical protein
VLYADANAEPVANTNTLGFADPDAEPIAYADTLGLADPDAEHQRAAGRRVWFERRIDQ